MLTPLPCIKYLIGCNNGTVDTGDSGAGTSSSSYSVPSYSSSVSSSLPDVRGSLPSSPSASLGLPSLKDTFVEYILSVKNIGTDAVNAVKISHGPLPFGATFDPTKSSQQCALSGKTVECMLNLLPKESQDLTLTYKSSSSFSCYLAKILQSAKSTLQHATGTAGSNPVVVSVKCSMKSVDRSATNGTDTASSAATTYQDSSSGSGASTLVSDSGNSIIPVDTGYKPYIVPAMPQTGAAQYLFTSATDHTVLLLPKRTEESGLSFLPLFLLSCCSIIVIYQIANQQFRSKTSHKVPFDYEA